MQAKETTAAYELFVEIHANYTSQDVEQVRIQISPDQFEERVRALHEQYMTGQFSFGKFSELIGVPHAELWDILDMLGLPRHN